MDRRAWLRYTAVSAATIATGAGTAGGLRAARGSRNASVPAPLRPPGSLPETDFLALCVRCGACFQACPNNVLQPMGFDQGIERLWTPAVVADWSGCEPSCANCGQVCPTGAIRPLPLEEKRFARIGLAEVDAEICLPLAVGQPCQLCVDECRASGYDAIDLVRLGGGPQPGDDPAAAVLGQAALYAPVVRPDRCVGCGLCQARCHHINVKTKRRFARSAIRVVGGEGGEDRIRSGSYRALEEQRRRAADAGTGSPGNPPPQPGTTRGGYLPDFLERRE